MNDTTQMIESAQELNYTWIIVLAVAAIFIIWRIYIGRQKSNVLKELNRNIAIARAAIEENFDNSFIPVVKKGAFIKTDTGIMLKKGEKIILALPQIELYEQRIEKITGKSTGVSLRIMKGVTIRQSFFDAQAKQVMKHLDTGSLTLTNSRIVYNGSTQNREFPISRINTVEATDTGIMVGRSGKQKTEWYRGFDIAGKFSVTNPSLKENVSIGIRGAYVKAIITEALEGEFDPIAED